MRLDICEPDYLAAARPRLRHDHPVADEVLRWSQHDHWRSGHLEDEGAGGEDRPRSEYARQHHERIPRLHPDADLQDHGPSYSPPVGECHEDCNVPREASESHEGHVSWLGFFPSEGACRQVSPKWYSWRNVVVRRRGRR